tara:strand:+ start:345 stop:1214 length:870 start_codon:yes stop_codon:yes gene_type:complete
MESEENLSSIRGDEPESSVLYVVGTPIGNLNDISFRSKNLLSKVSFIACEDTRHTKKMLNALKIKNKLISFNEYNSKVKTEHIINKLKEGVSVALVSDAGMPLISDPGEYLVSIARKQNIEVICSPGPCAALTSLVTSGLSSSCFSFIGFVPKKKIERDKCFKNIANNSHTTIVYESPKRIKSFIRELRNYCEDSRIVHISKELTKKYEDHWKGNLHDISYEIENIDPKGEFTIVIEGMKIKKDLNEMAQQLLRNDLDELIKLGLKRRSAASYLANKNGIAKNIIYNLK